MTRSSKQIILGSIPVGGGAQVSVQSMTNTDTRKHEETLVQIFELQKHGCEIIRVAIPDDKAAEAFRIIAASSPLPVVADIHFDHRLALKAIEAGANGIRINPGNIGDEKRIFRIIDAAGQNGAAIRIGVNSGSLEKELLAEFGRPSPEALAQSALNQVRLFESRNFENFKISIKSSSVMETIEANRIIARLCEYPLHIGVTEAGSNLKGAIKSAIGIGVLLQEGIGDTIRVSLTGDPVQEVLAAYEILRAVGLRKRGPEIISCPTCGRTEIDLLHLAHEVEKACAQIEAPLKIAVMGCVVNGPGEAREADLGLAGGRDKGVIFRKGQPVMTVKGQHELLKAFMEELAKVAEEFKPLR